MLRPSIDDEMALFGEKTEEAVIERFAKRKWHAIAIKRVCAALCTAD